jgi:hypothetical protein
MDLSPAPSAPGSPAESNATATTVMVTPVREESVVLAPLLPGLGQYVVSIRSGSRRTRLHLVGACHRIPGRDYQEFEVLGEQLPPASAYADFCRQCWPGGRPVRFSEADDIDSANTTSSSSDAEGSA